LLGNGSKTGIKINVHDTRHFGVDIVGKHGKIIRN